MSYTFEKIITENNKYQSIWCPGGDGGGGACF